MRSPAQPNSARNIIKGWEMREQGGEWGELGIGCNCLFGNSLRLVSGDSVDPEGDGLRGGLAGSAGDGQGVRGGFPGSDIDATGVGRPDRTGGRIERDGFGVGDVVAE